MLKVANSVINASQITGVLPVVNGGTGVTTSTGTGNTVLSASPTLSGDVNLSTGNLVIGTSGKGIDFSATSHPAGMTSELLADYEEGTCTISLTATGSGTITLNASFETFNYTKIGRQVTVTGYLSVASVSSPVGALVLNGLPYTSIAGDARRSSLAVLPGGLMATAVSYIGGFVNSAATTVTFYKYSAGALSNLAGDVQAGTEMFLTITYQT